MAAGITGSDCGEAIIEINLPTSFWVNEIVFESQSRYGLVDNYPRNFQLYYCWDCDGFGYVLPVSVLGEDGPEHDFEGGISGPPVLWAEVVQENIVECLELLAGRSSH